MLKVRKQDWDVWRKIEASATPAVQLDAIPSPAEWLGWSRERIARWVSGLPEPLVVGWPFDGTRRWYLLHRRNNPDAGDYVSSIVRRQAEHHRLLFEHGAAAVLAPCFGYELLGRGEEYTRVVAGAVLRLHEDVVNREMFENGVRLRFYGDYEEVLDTPTFRPMLRACEELTAATAAGDGPLLLMGLFADAPYPRLARLSVEFAAERGRPPDRRELIEAYYGIPVPDLSLYLGFARPTMFDIPLLATGEEDLYATVTPSPDLTEKQLREILYDHFVSRRVEDPDYETLSEEAHVRLERYNRRHREMTLGVGCVDPVTGLWNPLLTGLWNPLLTGLEDHCPDGEPSGEE